MWSSISHTHIIIQRNIWKRTTGMNVYNCAPAIEICIIIVILIVEKHFWKAAENLCTYIIVNIIDFG